jgi:hypothetical protein
MNARRQYLPFGAVLALLTAWFTLAGPISIANAQGQSGTSLDAAVTTAVGFSETTTAFGWVTAIEAVPTDLSLSTGASGTINYTLTATRTVASQTTTSGVSGTIQVTNAGETATQGLSISVAVQAQTGGGAFTTIATAPVNTQDHPVLAPGETGSYSYAVNFTPVAGASAYRVAAQVSITNHSGHLGTAFGPVPTQGFSLPSTPSTRTVDSTASVSFTQTNLSGAGFTVSAAPRDVAFSESGRATFSTTITNSNATPASTSVFVTTATLTQGDTRQQRTASATVNIRVP